MLFEIDSSEIHHSSFTIHHSFNNMSLSQNRRCSENLLLFEIDFSEIHHLSFTIHHSLTSFVNNTCEYALFTKLGEMG